MEPMKRLTIIYDNTVLFDGEVAELAWQDAAHQVSVTGKLKHQAPTTAASVGGILDLLAGARRERTAEAVRERRREFYSEQEEAAAIEQEGLPVE
jgi:hypothetical protein